MVLTNWEPCACSPYAVVNCCIFPCAVYLLFPLCSHLLLYLCLLHSSAAVLFTIVQSTISASYPHTAIYCFILFTFTFSYEPQHLSLIVYTVVYCLFPMCSHSQLLSLRQSSTAVCYFVQIIYCCIRFSACSHPLVMVYLSFVWSSTVMHCCFFLMQPSTVGYPSPSPMASSLLAPVMHAIMLQLPTSASLVSP